MSDAVIVCTASGFGVMAEELHQQQQQQDWGAAVEEGVSTAGHFNHCRKEKQQNVLPPFLHSSTTLPHTLICIFLWLPSISVHPVPPVIHLFPPPHVPLCFLFFFHLCVSAPPHRNARPDTSSLPALGISFFFFTGMKKCNHPSPLIIRPHSNSR